MVAKLGNSHWHKERPREQVWGAGEGGEVAASNSWQSSCKENRAGDISAPGKVPSGVVGWAPRGGAPPFMEGIKLLVPVPLQMDLPRALPFPWCFYGVPSPHADPLAVPTPQAGAAPPSQHGCW